MAKKTDSCLAADEGELQWTKYGVSGIVIFQLSRFVSSCMTPENLYLEIDLLPDFEEHYLMELLSNRAARLSKERIAVLLEGILHEKLIPAIIKMSGISEKSLCRELSGEQLQTLIKQAKQFRLAIEGTKSFDACQVCLGGVDCHEISWEDLQSKKHDGLYFSGEILDVDGPCGGYNLQWAWSSGHLAGTSAAGL